MSGGRRQNSIISVSQKCSTAHTFKCTERLGPPLLGGIKCLHMRPISAPKLQGSFLLSNLPLFITMNLRDVFSRCHETARSLLGAKGNSTLPTLVLPPKVASYTGPAVTRPPSGGAGPGAFLTRTQHQQFLLIK